MYFTIFQRGSLEESVTKNTFNSILILCLYKFRSGYMQIIQIFFTKQEYILSVLIGGAIFPHLTESSIWIKIGFP